MASGGKSLYENCGIPTGADITYQNRGTVLEAATISELNITTNFSSNFDFRKDENYIMPKNQISKKIFCDRWPELRLLKDLLQTSSTSPLCIPNIAVVSGLGGIGKTKLVNEFIKKNRSSYEEIIFIDAESIVSMKESFKKVATDTLNISITNVDGKEQTLGSIIERALEQLSKTKTLFVYDNVTNIKNIKFVLTKSTIGDNGHIIITSRLQEWGSAIKVFWLKELASTEAIEYVSIMLNAPYDSYDDRKSLVEMLQAFPLALIQAISYINQERAKQIYRISDYIEKCYTREILNSQLFQDIKYYFYKNTTFTTWDCTIDEIKRNKASGQLAIKILNIIAYFDREKIHRHIFLHLPSDGHIEITEENVISAVRLLVNYSMVNCQDYRSILSVHRLVQAVIKLKLEENNQEKQILRDALTLITKLIEEAPDKLTEINSHATSVFVSALKFEDLREEFSALPVKILNSLIESRKYERAEAFGNKILQPMVNFLGADYGHTIKQLLQRFPQSYGQSFGPAVPETEPIRFNVQIPDINFVGRLPELRRLEAAMESLQKPYATKPHTIVVSGLGGVGKTQLVRKFVDNNQSSYKNIIWINSEKNELINESFKILADKLNIPIISADGKVKFFEFVVEAVLAKVSKNKTLFVYDNVEKIEDIKFALTLQQIEDQCHVIITTRIQEWGGQIDVIFVKEWTIEDAVKYVSQTLKHTCDSDEDIKLLVEMLQYFPLALRQATAYINYQRMMQRFEIGEYVAKFNTQEMFDSKLFQDSPLNFYQTTFTTCGETIDAIGKDSENGPLAVRILYIISYFHPDNIYRDIFTHLTYRQPTSFIKFILSKFNLRKSSLETYNDQNIRAAVRLLINYSMVDSQQNQSVFNIHRLVQLVVKEKCEKSNQEETTLQDGLCLFSNLIKVNHPKLNSSLTHFASVFTTALKYENLVKEFSELSSHILSRLNYICRCSEAEAFGNKILHTFIDIFGEDDSNTLKIKSCISSASTEVDNHTKALQIHEEVFKEQIETLGKDHPETLVTYSNIAYAYNHLGSHTQALQMHQEVLEKRINILGENHPQTLATKSNIAHSLSDRGEHIKALQIYQDVFEKERIILGEDHPRTLATESNIAYAYNHLGSHIQALQMHQEVLEKQINILGDDHLRTLTTKSNIAYAYNHLGSHTQALQIYQEVLEKQINILGDDHLRTLTTKSNIAYAYNHLGSHTQALQIYQEVFEKEINILGEDHLQTLATKSDIAYTYNHLGSHTQALQMYKEVFEKQRNIFGEDHPQTLATKSDIAYTYNHLGSHTQALQMYKEVFEKQRNIFGEDHPQTLATKSDIAYTYNHLGGHTQALQMYKEVFEKQRNIFGEDHLQTLATKSDIAYTYNHLGSHTQALQMYKEVFEKQRNIFGEDHPQTLATKSDIAYTYNHLGSHTQALQMYKEVFEKQRNIFGEDHPQTLATKSKISDVDQLALECTQLDLAE